MNIDHRMVRSVERAIDALEAVARHGHPMTLGELAAALSAPKSTTLNIVRTLVRRRVLAVDARTKTYSFGFFFGAIAGHAPALDLRTLAKPHLERLSEATQEVVLLAALDGREITFVEKIDSRQPIRYIADIGTRRPLHCTAAGKLALSIQPPSDVDAYVAEVGLRRYTPTTIDDPERLKLELATIRRRGYALSDREFIPDLIGVALPVFAGAGGPFVAGIVVAGPAFRMRGRVRHIVRAAKRAADELGAEAARFGHVIVTGRQ
jgi:DNA-binding IclR family transcriptional regulator